MENGFWEDKSEVDEEGILLLWTSSFTSTNPLTWTLDPGEPKDCLCMIPWENTEREKNEDKKNTESGSEEFGVGFLAFRVIREREVQWSVR